jgi:hypothetical protein
MPANVALTTKSHQATSNSPARRCHKPPSKREMAIPTTSEDTTPITTATTIAATTNTVSVLPPTPMIPRKTTYAKAVSTANIPMFRTILYGGGRRIATNVAVAPRVLTMSAGTGATNTSAKASGISDNENATDSRRNTNRKTLYSANANPATSAGSNIHDESRVASPSSGTVSNRATETSARTTASTTVSRSG